MNDRTGDLQNLISAADKLECGISVFGPNEDLLYVNETAYRNFPSMFDAMKAGRTLEAAVIESIFAIRPNISHDERKYVTEQVRAAIDSAEPTEMPTEDGKIVRLHFAASANGSRIGFSADVTQLRKREHELKQARREALAASSAKSDFLASMSHEIRTPLNGILGMAQILHGRDLFGEEKEMVDAILESSKSLMTVLNDILDLSKIEAGKLDITRVPDDLRHKIGRIEAFHRPMAEEKGLHLRFVVDPCLPDRLSFDPVRVRQCLDNLVSNAIKFTRTGSIIVAVTSEPCSSDARTLMVKLHVSDTGIGIGPRAIGNLFEDFSQGEASTSRRYGGTGLGLSIARRLARLMGGDLTAVSRVGKGSIFTLSFQAGIVSSRRAPATALAPASTSFDQVIIQPGSGRLGPFRVLVVDDNAINRRVARLFLDPLGLQVTEAVNGEEALGLLASEPYDLVLLDIHMPVLDGPGTLRRIRNSGRDWATLPVIALTADAMFGDREKFVAMGMDGYVSKPIDERQFISTITSTLAGRTPRAVQRVPSVTGGDAFDYLFEPAARAAG